MNEQRASKKQRELLSFIDGFIKGNGYGPSYREIMRALDYKSVSTVAVHVDGLITRGYLRKRDHSARSLEVVSLLVNRAESVPHEEWLKLEIEKRLARSDEPGKRDEARSLIAAARVLGFASTAQHFTDRLQEPGTPNKV